MRCKDCVYCWQEEGENYATCHFVQATCFDVPPCEWEDIETAEAEAEAIAYAKEKNIKIKGIYDDMCKLHY